MFQTLLPLKLKEDYSLAKWVIAPCNEIASHWILQNSYSKENKMACLYGNAQSGKTHLAHIFVHLFDGMIIKKLEKNKTARDFLNQYHHCHAFAFDTFEAFEETWLFDAYNILKERKDRVLWVSSRAPQTWVFRLPDLHSRLRSLPFLSLGMPDDKLRKRIIIKRLDDCGVRIDEDAVDYLLNRIPRSLPILYDWVFRLDCYSSLLKRRISKGMIRDLLIKETSS